MHGSKSGHILSFRGCFLLLRLYSASPAAATRSADIARPHSSCLDTSVATPFARLDTPSRRPLREPPLDKAVRSCLRCRLGTVPTVAVRIGCAGARNSKSPQKRRRICGAREKRLGTEHAGTIWTRWIARHQLHGVNRRRSLKQLNAATAAFIGKRYIVLKDCFDSVSSDPAFPRHVGARPLEPQ